MSEPPKPTLRQQIVRWTVLMSIVILWVSLVTVFTVFMIRIQENDGIADTDPSREYYIDEFLLEPGIH